MQLFKKIFPCLFKKQKHKIAPLPQQIWFKEELDIVDQIRELRPVDIHNDLKWLAEKRLKFQLQQPGITHSYFFGDAEVLKKAYGWKKVVELLSSGYTHPIEGFLNSESHREAILKEELKYVGVAYGEHVYVVILGY